MIKKAYDLIQKRRVEHIGEGAYNVVGKHGTYTVAQKIDGSVNCNCLGFLRLGRCSHSLAVLMLTKPGLLRAVKKEIVKTGGKQNFKPNNVT